MTPFKSPQNQKEANALSANVQKFWRQSYGDYQLMMGPENIAAEDQIIQLNFADAGKRINEIAKQLKTSAKSKPKGEKNDNAG